MADEEAEEFDMFKKLELFHYFKIRALPESISKLK
ncbi:MAG: hypothetical protein ACJATI_003317 [Halioglobus sp.]